MYLLEKAHELGVDKWTVADFVLGVESLRQQLADMKAYNAMRTDELLAATRQLAECERERDEARNQCVKCGLLDAAKEQLATVTKERDELVASLNQFAECDLNDDNCASLEVATRRIRSIAKAALAKLGTDKTGDGR